MSSTTLPVQDVELILSLQTALDRHDQFLQASKAMYKQASGEKILDLEFQKHALKQIWKARTNNWPVYAVELATGSGKTVIAAKLARRWIQQEYANFSTTSPVLYVCANRAALGDFSQGIVNIFHRVFGPRIFGYGPRWETERSHDVVLGPVNDLSAAYDVSFVTPRRLLQAENDNLLQPYLQKCPLVIVDEAHHFPDDQQEKLKVYNEVYRALKQWFIPKPHNRLVLAMTGTYERMDQQPILGRERPDYVFTVQDAINAGRCPEIYGIQVTSNVSPKSAAAVGDFFDLQLTDEEVARYYEEIAKCVLLVYKKTAAPFAVFVRTQADARAIVEIFNRESGLGEHGAGLLLGQTTQNARLEIMSAIRSGGMAGYVTCSVGEESLDIPVVEVVHLVRRCRSYVKNAQAVGRALRVHPGKKRALIVDYQMMVASMQARWLGLNLDDYAVQCHTRIGEGQRINGGPLVCQRDYPSVVLAGMSISEERALLLESRRRSKGLVLQADKYVAEEEARYHRWRREVLPAAVRDWLRWRKIWKRIVGDAPAPVCRIVTGGFVRTHDYAALADTRVLLRPDWQAFEAKLQAGTVMNSMVPGGPDWERAAEKRTALCLYRYWNDEDARIAVSLAAIARTLAGSRRFGWQFEPGSSTSWSFEEHAKAVVNSMRDVWHEMRLPWWPTQHGDAWPIFPDLSTCDVFSVAGADDLVRMAAILYLTSILRVGLFVCKLAHSSLPEPMPAVQTVLIERLLEQAERGVRYKDLDSEARTDLEYLVGQPIPEVPIEVLTRLTDLAPDWFVEFRRHWAMTGLVGKLRTKLDRRSRLLKPAVTEAAAATAATSGKPRRLFLRVPVPRVATPKAVLPMEER